MRAVVPRRREVLRRFVVVAVALAVYAALTAGLYRQMTRPGEAGEPRVAVVQGARPPTRNVTVKDGWFWVGGERLHVSAVGWDPVRPGELPWQRTFRARELEEDLARIRAAGFNAVRTWAPLSPEELALVERAGLYVLQGVWVDPAGDFADPAFRRRTLAEVARAVEGSRWSAAVLGYLVLNEPRARQVARAGLDETRAFLREVVATVRALDPSAPVGYASWPGMEALDDPLLDFVAFNLYPHRPRVVMDELGLAGYVALLRRTVARGRPLLVSEFGLSVSPKAAVRGRGGASEEEQAAGLVELASLLAAGGATGTAVFQWSDGWWKNHEQPGDEATHDPADPEEWFGLVRFEDLEDRTGTARPALEAIAAYNRAILVAPLDGPVSGEAIPVRVVSREPVRLEVSVNRGERYPVELWPAGRDLWEGKLFLPAGGTRADFAFHLLDEAGEEIRRERRLLHTGGPRSTALSVDPPRQVVAPGAAFTVEVQALGDRVAGVSVSVATYTEDRYNEERVQVATGPDGRVLVPLTAPHEETILAVLAFEDDPAVPPAERASAHAVVEVRRP